MIPTHRARGHSTPLRVLKVIDNQVRDLRKRQVVASYQLELRLGTYRGIRSDIAYYAPADPLEAPHELTQRLAEIPTRLKRLNDTARNG